MDNYKNNIIEKNFKIEKDFELYIPKFHYCDNNNNNNKKKIDMMYKDLQNNTALYKEWNGIYDKIVLDNSTKVIDIIEMLEYEYITKFYNGKKFKNNINVKKNISENIKELYIYQIYNEDMTPKKIIITDKLNVQNNDINKIKEHIKNFDEVSNNIRKFTDTINLDNDTWKDNWQNNETVKEYIEQSEINKIDVNKIINNYI